MPTLLSNHLKAILFIGNIDIDHQKIDRYNVYTVQAFDYEYRRQRNSFGMPFGHTLSTVMHFTVRLLNSTDLKIFYKASKEANPQNYTFLFNATFAENRRLQEFEDAMVVSGYIVGIEEIYEPGINGKNASTQKLINVDLLVSHVKYKGEENDKKLTIYG